jgi:hypothetical protein
VGVIPNASALADLAALRAAALTTPKVHLYKALANPLSPLTVLGDFTEPTYHTYAALTAAFGSPYIDSMGRAVCDSPLLQFQPTDSVVAELVLGYFVTDGAGAVLLWAGSFPAPMQMFTPADAIPLILQFVLAPPGPPY